jgi:calcium-dependent protein kinase
MEVLAYIHSKGIIHRDIKPENMLFDLEKCELKIIDFGIAAVKTSEDQILNARIGTIYYIAPEVLLKEYN